MTSVDLVFKLAGLLVQPPVSVEIIPGSLDDWVTHGARPEFPFLLAEGNLGVPRMVLYALYLAAVVMFARRENIIASTSIMLLANPAHQTALNARKRLILRGELSAEQELGFTELLLRGSDECAKQSILWDHRRWIFLRLYGTTVVLSEELEMVRGWLGPLEWDNLPHLPVTAARKELELTRHACEIYPRNYHGWNHWRYITNVIYVRLKQAENREWKELVEEQFREKMEWVEGHVSDYTAMHHLHGFCERFVQDKGALVRQARELKTYYGTHEAVGCYGRLVGVDKMG